MSWTLDDLCVTAQEEVEKRHMPSPGGKVNSTLNARTVRYYTTLGLVDRPTGYEGGVACYGERICCSAGHQGRSSPSFCLSLKFSADSMGKAIQTCTTWWLRPRLTRARQVVPRDVAGLPACAGLFDWY